MDYTEDDTAKTMREETMIVATIHGQVQDGHRVKETRENECALCLSRMFNADFVPSSRTRRVQKSREGSKGRKLDESLREYEITRAKRPLWITAALFAVGVLFFYCAATAILGWFSFSVSSGPSCEDRRLPVLRSNDRMEPVRPRPPSWDWDRPEAIGPLNPPPPPVARRGVAEVSSAKSYDGASGNEGSGGGTNVSCINALAGLFPS